MRFKLFHANIIINKRNITSHKNRQTVRLRSQLDSCSRAHQYAYAALYVHQNQVVEGLVFRAEDYIYSSAADYTGEKGLFDVIVIK